MFSPPIPQIPGTTEAPIPTAIEFTKAELVVVKKWLSVYSETDKAEWYDLLKAKILPQLYPLNKDLPANAWKDRKSVSMQ